VLTPQREPETARANEPANALSPAPLLLTLAVLALFTFSLSLGASPALIAISQIISNVSGGPGWP
jgi:hypothetical protein